MDAPEFLHRNEGFDASFAGAGVKLQWFPLAEQRALFLDLGIGVSRREATFVASRMDGSELATAIGASAGYRFLLPYSLYVTPWAGVDVDLDRERGFVVDGHRFQTSRVTPFAAVHFGYRFR